MMWWIFQNVVITTALVAAVVTACRVGRLGPVARHALWVLVLLKFVTPPLVVWPWALPDPFGVAAIDVRINPAAAIATSAPPAFAQAGDDHEDHGGAERATPSRAGRSVMLTGVEPIALNWLLALWAVGSLGLAGIEGIRLIRLARQIRTAAPVDQAIADHLADLAGRLGIAPIRAVKISGLASPLVWGLGQPCLLWPAILPPDTTSACIDGLLVHELAHVKRRDHLVGWIELAAGVIWWWNPLFWYVRSALREQAELACDAWVISTLPRGRRAYAEALLALSVTTAGGTSSSLAVVGARATSRRILERRLVMIMKGRTPLRLPLAGLCTIALVALATLPAWATSPQAPPAPAPPPVQVPVLPTSPPSASVLQAPSSPPAIAVPAVPVARSQAAPKPTPPARTIRPAQVKVPTPTHTVRFTFARTAGLPEEGKALVEALDKEQAAILENAQKQIAARRDATIKALQALQDQFAKEGKLDEAVAIRDYLRAGGPGAKAALARTIK